MCPQLATADAGGEVKHIRGSSEASEHTVIVEAQGAALSLKAVDQIHTAVVTPQLLSLPLRKIWQCTFTEKLSKLKTKKV